MTELKAFSFRYGSADGSMVWYRLDNEKGVNVGIDMYDSHTKEQKELRYEPEQQTEKALREILKQYQAEKWNGFYDKIMACKCDMDAWVFHVYFKDNTEIHAMGYAGYPDGFWDMKKALDLFFDEIWKKYYVSGNL